MTDFIADKNRFHEYKSRFHQLFINEEFINNPFSSDFKCFLSFEFNFIYNKLFNEGLKRFLKKIGDKTIIFYTIEPSPEDYFYKHFKKYSVFEISINASHEELNHILMKNPGDSHADALAINSNEIAWFSNSNEWAIIGSRDWEIAVIGFSNVEIKQKFFDCYSKESQTMFTSMQVQVDDLAEIFDFNEKLKIGYEKMIENYKDR